MRHGAHGLGSIYVEPQTNFKRPRPHLSVLGNPVAVWCHACTPRRAEADRRRAGRVVYGLRQSPAAGALTGRRRALAPAGLPRRPHRGQTPATGGPAAWRGLVGGKLGMPGL